MNSLNDVKAVLKRYRGRRLPTLNLTDMTKVSADTLQAALLRPVIIATVDGGQPELLIHRDEGAQRQPLQVAFANRRQAMLFVSGANALRDPLTPITVGELHWSLLQAARMRQAA